MTSGAGGGGKQVLRMSHTKFHLSIIQFVVILHGLRDLSSLSWVGGAENSIWRMKFSNPTFRGFELPCTLSLLAAFLHDAKSSFWYPAESDRQNYTYLQWQVTAVWVTVWLQWLFWQYPKLWFPNGMPLLRVTVCYRLIAPSVSVVIFFGFPWCCDDTRKWEWIWRSVVVAAEFDRDSATAVRQLLNRASCDRTYRQRANLSSFGITQSNERELFRQRLHVYAADNPNNDAKKAVVYVSACKYRSQNVCVLYPV